MFNNKDDEDSGAFCWGLLYNHYHGPYLYETEIITLDPGPNKHLKFHFFQLLIPSLLVFGVAALFWLAINNIGVVVWLRKPISNKRDKTGVLLSETTLYDFIISEISGLL